MKEYSNLIRKSASYIVIITLINFFHISPSCAMEDNSGQRQEENQSYKRRRESFLKESEKGREELGVIAEASRGKRPRKEGYGEFQGKIISSIHDAESFWFGVTGHHYVFYPEDREDVAKAVGLSKTENLKAFIHSGIHLTQDDTVDGTGGIVINLKHLSDVGISGHEVIPQAGATIEVVSEQLAKNNLALPLADNPLKSISSNVLSEEKNPSYLMRSLGPISHYITEIMAVKPDGEHVTFVEEPSLTQCKECKAVVTLTLSFGSSVTASSQNLAHKTALPPTAWIYKIITPLKFNKGAAL